MVNYMNIIKKIFKKIIFFYFFFKKPFFIVERTKCFYTFDKYIDFLKKEGNLNYYKYYTDALISFFNYQKKQKHGLILDIGAHVGSFGAGFLNKHINKLIFVEPSPSNIISLQNLYLNSVKKKLIEIIPKACFSKSNKYLVFNETNSSTVGHLDKFNFYKFTNKKKKSYLVNKKIKIKSIDLSDIIKKYYYKNLKENNILKMDCECAEYVILKSKKTQNIIKLFFKYLIIETHPCQFKISIENIFNTFEWRKIKHPNGCIEYYGLNKKKI